jgi:DNA polymerase III subunit gamma/tau
MEKFIVSARKYRPVTFDTVVGQPSITNTLKNAIRNNHLAQAFLFTGPRGVGKTTTARILAKTINCQNITDNIEACNVCETCVAFNNGHSLNIYELDAASNNSVEDIRALVDQVRYAPQIGKYKVYIIDEVHMLSASAFNAFLKTLEEPPSYAVFILATTEKHKIIPTILSRCQIFDFNRISVEDIVSHLKAIAEKENVSAEEDALHIIAQKADGALRDSLSLFDQLVSFAGNTLTYKDVIANLNILDYDYYFRVTDEILAGNIPNVLITFNEILNKGFDGHNFINGLASHFRDLLVCKDEITLTLLEVSPNVREKYKVQSRFCQSTWLMEMLDLAGKADVQYRSAKNQRLHIELTLLKMSAVAGKSPTPEPAKKKVDLNIIPQPQGPPTPPADIPAIPVAIKAVKESIPLVSTADPVRHLTAEIKSDVVPAIQSRTTAPAPAIRKSISINGKLSGLKEKSFTADTEETLPDLSSSFELFALEKCWNEYATQMLKEGRMTLNAAMMKRKPEVIENHLMKFTVDSGALLKDMNDQKADILAFLRKQLSNYKIDLEVQVNNTEDISDIPYTPSEKFKKLAEKNPLLHELKKHFELEIDY